MSPQCRPPSLIDPKWWEKGGKSQLPCFATDLPLFKGFSWQSWKKDFPALLWEKILFVWKLLKILVEVTFQVGNYFVGSW